MVVDGEDGFERGRRRAALSRRVVVEVVVEGPGTRRLVGEEGRVREVRSRRGRQEAGERWVS